jgi:cold shock CspA family protein
MKAEFPLIIVFYLDRQMMQNGEIIQPFAESVNMALSERNANAMAFFIPTDGEERVEVINPIQIEEVEMAKINKLVEDIKNNFDIGQDKDNETTGL